MENEVGARKRESASTGNKKVFGGWVLNRVPLFLFTARFWAPNSETDAIEGRLKVGPPS